jgi:hypothetical protein
MKNHSNCMNTPGKQVAALLLLIVCFFSCKKEDDSKPQHESINNSSWKVEVTVTGNTTTQNIFEFANDGAYFSWHPAAAASYKGTWSQTGATVTFTFNETTTAGEYSWDNTGTLSSGDTILTGTMQRRGAQGSGTFIAKRL